jgi:hypothetical protein
MPGPVTIRIDEAGCIAEIQALEASDGGDFDAALVIPGFGAHALALTS